MNDDVLYDEVPSLDLANFTDGNNEQRKNFVRDLGKTFQDIGFVAIKNHGLTDELAARLYKSVTEFFALPEAAKLRYELKNLGGQRGYTAKGKEHAKGENIGDLKEFYHVGQELSAADCLRLKYPVNVFPSEIPDFETSTIEAFRTLEAAGLQLLRAIALHLNLDENYFDNQVNQGNSILRAIHYFPLASSQELASGAVRAAAHGDINLITLLMGASAEGLQILRQDGKWIPVTALPNQIVVNVGDMLERLTNKKLKSTIHRVVNPPTQLLGTARYSIPFFMHPISQMSLDCLPSCIDEKNPKYFDEITSGEFLNQRLQEIGLIE